MPFDPSSREAEAQAELAATRQRRGVVPALVAGFLAVLAAGPALELGAALGGRSAVLAPLPELPDLDALFEEIEVRFDERSALVRATRPEAQALLTRLARFGNERTTVGRDGWLFFRDDVEHLVARRPAPGFAGDPATTIRAFRDELAAHGVGLVVVPTPLKPTVHPEKLARGAAAPPVRRDGEAELLAAVAGAGVEVLDLADRFVREARFAPLYLATDTHWRPEAVEIAARELAILLRERFELPPGEPSWRETAIERRRGVGDTAAMLELPASASLVAAETVETRPVAARAGAPGEVLVLGDSFAGIYSSPDLGWGAGAGLSDRLAAQLGLPVDRILRNAGGASATRDALADAWRRDPARFASLRVVVWQLAARELSQGEWRDVELPAAAH